MMIMTTPPSLHAPLHFLKRNELYEHEKPYVIQYFPHGDIPRSNVEQEIVPDVQIHDMRPMLASLDFERDGFVVRDLSTRLSRDDFAEPEKVKATYLAEVKDMLCELFGTRNVAPLEYMVRRRSKDFPNQVTDDSEYAQPVATAHIDFSPDCIVEIIRDRYAHRADELLKHPYKLVNIWKPLAGPLLDWPLTLCMPSSIDSEMDLQLMDRVYPANVEESIQVHHDARHKWYYLSRQRADEALVFRGGDSTIGMSAGVPHCSFDISNILKETVVPRESIEVRALIFDAAEDLDLDSVAPSRRHGPKTVYNQVREINSTYE